MIADPVCLSETHWNWNFPFGTSSLESVYSSRRHAMIQSHIVRSDICDPLHRLEKGESHLEDVRPAVLQEAVVEARSIADAIALLIVGQ